MVAFGLEWRLFDGWSCWPDFERTGEASDNDRFAAGNLLNNAVIASKGDLPGCQDTGTGIVAA